MAVFGFVVFLYNLNISFCYGSCFYKKSHQIHMCFPYGGCVLFWQPNICFNFWCILEHKKRKNKKQPISNHILSGKFFFVGRRTSCFISLTLNWKGILTMILKGQDAGGENKCYLDKNAQFDFYIGLWGADSDCNNNVMILPTAISHLGNYPVYMGTDCDAAWFCTPSPQWFQSRLQRSDQTCKNTLILLKI